jgi:N-acetylglucosamine-6-phosphate deacetylase
MNEPYALVGEVLTTAGPTQAAVVIRDGKIDAVLREPRSGDLPRKHREFAGFLCPGFIDLQINGAFGADIGPDPEAIRTLVAKLPATGVTSFLPTLISSPPERYEEFLTALDRIRTGIIADGVHVHEAAIRLAHRAKGSEGLVTDAMEAAGMPPGDYELGGRKVHLEDGAVRLPDGTLAGSARTMDEAVRNTIRFLSVSLAQAVCMAAETPATAPNLVGKGKIAVGCDADSRIRKAPCSRPP